MEDDTQLTEIEYTEESDFDNEYISNDDNINISDDNEFYEQDDDDNYEWSLYFNYGDSLINVSKYVIVLINMCFYYVTNILITLSFPWPFVIDTHTHNFEKSFIKTPTKSVTK